MLPQILIAADWSLAAGDFAATLPVVGALLLIALVGHLILALVTARRHSGGRKRGFITQLVYLAFIISVGVLAVTSLGTILRFGHMSGYALLTHLTAAGAFVFLLIAIALFYLPRPEENELEDPLADQRWWLGRWSSWGLVLSSLLAAGVMFLSMLPILGTDGLVQAIDVHRYASLTVVVMAILHLYALAITRLGWR